MKSKLTLTLTLTLAGAALAVFALAGCSSQASSGSSPSSAGSPSSASASTGSTGSGGSYGSGSAGASGASGATGASGSAAASGADIATASTSLGTVVVDGKGLTAYYYDADTANSGKSVCTGACAGLWPAITTTSATPTMKGITGRIGEITDPAGTKQITINGRPIYTFADDAKPGDVNGQGAQGVWYVVSPTGAEIKTAK